MAAARAAALRETTGADRLRADRLRADARAAEERAKLEALSAEMRKAADGYLREPTAEELQTALELIGEAPAKPEANGAPDPKERPADMPAPTPEVSCSHGAGVYENPGDPPGVWRCNQCNTRVDANGQPLPAEPVN